MRNLIRRTARALALLLTPGTGTHRAGARPVRQPPAPHHHHHAAVRLPLHRSPYGLDLGPCDGGASPLVRPYLIGMEVEVAA
ncbi:hypothetical protein [Streptomyces adelaidensis]|uniref:hypothetical protein n=1 Tax=Streptomyces adelaidensis TaxID=2796465 RepID=UPI0019079B9B|nr:hypothetical protein [Streptomyces adelaidensis]